MAALPIQAVHRRNLIAVDENKARRILSEQFPEVNVLRSADILTDTSAIQALGDVEAKECFAKACQFGRMRITH